MQQKYIWGGLILALALIVGSLLISEVKPRISSEPVRIGAIFSLTGNGAAYGEPMRDGAVLAVEEINMAGGVDGLRIELILEDSQFDAKTAVSSYKSLRARGVELFLSNGSSVSLALSPLVRADRTLLFETGAVTPKYSDGSPYTCRMTLTAVPAVEALAHFAATKLRAKRVASLTLNDDYGSAMKDAFKTAAEQRGLEVVLQDSVPKDEKDIRSYIARLMTQGRDIDALMLIPIAAHIEPALRQLRELGWAKPILSDNYTIINPSLKDSALAEGVYFSNYDWDVAALDPRFVAAFTKRFGNTPSALSGNGYDEIMLFAQAIREAKVVSGENIARYFTERLGTYRGVSGNLVFNSDCESPRKAVTNQVQNGQFVLVTP